MKTIKIARPPLPHKKILISQSFTAKSHKINVREASPLPHTEFTFSRKVLNITRARGWCDPPLLTPSQKATNIVQTWTQKKM
jgi:hypothetical protein